MLLGNIKISSNPPLALSPMAGYTNAALCTIMAEEGADMVYTELASAAALSRSASPSGAKPAKTDLLVRTPRGGLSAIQLFGSNAKEISSAIKYLSKKIETGECSARLFDLNLGCPATKVCKTGAGSALLTSPKKLREIASSAIKASPLPVSAKMRICENIDDSVSIAKLLEKEGICALAVHGRTRAQGYSGKSDWKSIGKIKESAQIPILGNGDVRCAQDAKKIMDVSGCDAVMIGRASLSNPLIFRQTHEFFAGKKITACTWERKIGFMEKYVRLCAEFEINFIYAKELSMQLASGFAGAAQMRGKLSKCKTEDELLEILSS
ncbi:hypothetical protein COU37_02325 [Candidatus Micrarchaeota archaeon CG10_big_fil_rev_8_21_14_0_10_45_29]|nr:MAG: hypothetical protein COU37_02325 [Candidatus Micrarchaeota archaeon CG10_big_fil_rev_8_21_14_0_10_45_29]